MPTLVDTRATGVRDSWVNTPVVPYKGQKYRAIKKTLCGKGELFYDSEMPSNSKSIYYSKVDASITWMRPSEICKVPKFSTEGTEANDLEEGDDGTPWFVSACASLALDNSLWKRVVAKAKEQDFDKAHQYAGIFHFQLWRHGYWFDVVVDDLLPVKDGQLVFCRSKSNSDFWAPLLEKAYAKLYGDYESLRMCKLTDALVDFTGGVAETRTITNAQKNDAFQRNKLLNSLYKSIENRSLINCEIQCKPSEVRSLTGDGMVRGQPYAVTDLREINMHKASSTEKGTEVTHVIRLCNPSSRAEWTGPWSIKSPEWTRLSVSDKQVLNLTFTKECEFWMSMKDFINVFTHVTICHFMNTSLFSTKKTYVEGMVFGEWTNGVSKSDKDRSGGSNSHPTFLMNPQYVLDMADDEDVVTFTLKQDDVALQRQLGQGHTSIGFYVMKVEENRVFRVHVTGKEVAISKYEAVREIYLRVKLTRGRYVVIPSTWDVDLTGKFLMRSYCATSINLRLLNDEIPTSISCLKPFMIVTVINVVKVTGLEAPKEGVLDVYAHVKCEGVAVKSASEKGTNDPTFNFRVIFYRRQPALKPIIIELYNRRAIRDELVGMAALTGQGPDKFNPEEMALLGKAAKGIPPPTVGQVTFEWLSNDNLAFL